MKTPAKLGLLAFLFAAGLAVTEVLQYVRDVLFHPWALTEPPLIDYWSGTLTTGNGVPLALVLDLERANNEECHNCAEIEGRAATCDGRGVVRRYRISGSPKDRHATDILLGAVPDPQPPPDGLEFSAIRGGWDGADAMTLRASFHWRKGTAAISATDDPATQPVPLRLRRSDAAGFEAVCSAVPGRGGPVRAAPAP